METKNTIYRVFLHPMVEQDFFHQQYVMILWQYDWTPKVVNHSHLVKDADIYSLVWRLAFDDAIVGDQADRDWQNDGGNFGILAYGVLNNLSIRDIPNKDPLYKVYTGFFVYSEAPIPRPLCSKHNMSCVLELMFERTPSASSGTFETCLFL